MGKLPVQLAVVRWIPHERWTDHGWPLFSVLQQCNNGHCGRTTAFTLRLSSLSTIKHYIVTSMHSIFKIPQSETTNKAGVNVACAVYARLMQLWFIVKNKTLPSPRKKSAIESAGFSEPGLPAIKNCLSFSDQATRREE